MGPGMDMDNSRPTECLYSNVQLCLGWMRNGIATELDIRAA